MTGGAAPSHRWLLPAATLALLVSGTAGVTVGGTLGLSGSGDDPTTAVTDPATTSSAPRLTSPSSPASSPAGPGGAASGSTSAGESTAPVADLADPAWVSATAAATGIPERALTAYAGASIAAGTTHPGCGIGWNTLAAIGMVESEHGALDGATLAADGTVSPRIIGVPLDGRGVAEIADTDRGELDGDTTWDRAVGPMQFIPATWAEHAADGNGDGTADVHNLDDAALTAALHLCAIGGDLTQPDSWVAAVSAYNAGRDYNTRVAEAATTYATAAGAA